MAETWVIQWVKEVENEGGVEYQVACRMPSGEMFLHIFDDDVLEWRAVEYGLDPVKEFDKVLDIALHERFIPDPTNPANFENDEAMKVGKKAPAVRRWGRQVQVGDEVPMHCYNAPSAKEAGEAHRLRIDAVKRDRVHIIPPQVSLLRSTTKPYDPLDLIRHNSVMNADQCEAKRDAVEETRANLLAQVEEVQTVRTFRVASSSSSNVGRIVGRPLRPVVTDVPYDDAMDRREEENG